MLVDYEAYRDHQIESNFMFTIKAGFGSIFGLDTSETITRSTRPADIELIHER